MGHKDKDASHNLLRSRQRPPGTEPENRASNKLITLADRDLSQQPHPSNPMQAKSHGIAALAAGLLWLLPHTSLGGEAQESRGDKMLADYFAAETAQLSDQCLAGLKTLDDWTSRREQYREQLLEMLGLSPRPKQSDLSPVVTGKVEADSFVVEKLHLQSLPGLYVTANLYLPKNLS